MTEYVIKLAAVGMNDVGRVGGKNASLGEMLRHLTRAGVQVPDGFATTADAYREFLTQTGLKARIEQRLRGLDIEDVRALAAAGRDIREWMVATPLPAALKQAASSKHVAVVSTKIRVR